MPFDNNPFVGQGALNFLNDNDFQNQINQQMNIGNNQNRSNALDAGLINFGAGMIGGPTLKEGLARGLMGFNQGYNASLNANKPKVTPLADGAFSQVTLPDGTSKIIGNQSVADFLMKREAARQLSKESLAILHGQVGTQKAASGVEVKQGAEAEPMLQSTQSMIDQYTKALEVVDSQANNSYGGYVNKAQVQALFPGIAGFFGGDEVAANKFLQGLKVDATLLNTAKTKGAISNEEMKLFASPIPDLTEDRQKVWKPYIEARLPVLKKLAKFYEEQVAAGKQAATGVNVVGNPNKVSPSTPKSTIPGLSEGASKYFSD